MTARSVWSGTITFGVVGVNVKAYKGTADSEKVSFHRIHIVTKDENGKETLCGGRVGYKNQCKNCGKEWGEGADSSDIGKGYEYAKGQHILIAEEELDQIAIESNKEIQIKGFIPVNNLDIRLFDSFYYLRQDGKGSQLALLKKAMESKGVVGIAQVCMRNKEYLVALRPMEDCFLMQIMFYPEELRMPEDFGKAEVAPRELEMAQKLIDMMSGNVDLKTFKNTYNEALTALVNSKISGTPSEVVTTKTRSAVDNTIDALEKSILALGAKVKTAEEKAVAEPKKTKVKKTKEEDGVFGL